MPKFTGVSISLNLQEAFEDAVRQALVAKVEAVGEPLSRIEVTRIFSVREETGSFNKCQVEIDAQ